MSSGSKHLGASSLQAPLEVQWENVEPESKNSSWQVNNAVLPYRKSEGGETQDEIILNRNVTIWIIKITW